MAPVARESDKPVVERPNVTGSDEVCRVSFGLESAGGRFVAFDVRPQAMLECDTVECCGGEPGDMAECEAGTSTPDEFEVRDGGRCEAGGGIWVASMAEGGTNNGVRDAPQRAAGIVILRLRCLRAQG